MIPLLSGNATGPKNGTRICLNKEVSANGINGNKLCVKMIANPTIPIVFGEHFNSKPSIINPHPIADNTSKRITLK